MQHKPYIDILTLKLLPRHRPQQGRRDVHTNSNHDQASSSIVVVAVVGFFAFCFLQPLVLIHSILIYNINAEDEEALAVDGGVEFA